MEFGLLGEKLTHSYSKLIHEKLGRYSYELCNVSRDDFRRIILEQKFKGLSVTIPYKQDAADLCDFLSETASSTESVNTLYWKDDRLWGDNTDYSGFLYAMNRSGISVRDKKVLLLGRGATSRTIQKALQKRGASEVIIAGRDFDFACCRDAEIIINATPVGTYPRNGEKILELAAFPECCGVMDVVYNPFFTDLLLRAKENGIPFSNGIPMLVAQATASAERFTGESFAGRNEELICWLEEKLRNIVLIGMPGSGKSSTGRNLAKLLSREFIDLDDRVEQEAGMSILDIFHTKGEQFFRDLETKVAKNCGKEHSLVIAAGGGTILRPENMDALRQNALVFFLDRSPELLATHGRPLSTDTEAVKLLYKQRIGLYHKHCDYIIDCRDSIESNTNKIIKIWEDMYS